VAGQAAAPARKRGCITRHAAASLGEEAAQWDTQLLLLVDKAV
jgi:hypothetical protein